MNIVSDWTKATVDAKLTVESKAKVYIDEYIRCGTCSVTTVTDTYSHHSCHMTMVYNGVLRIMECITFYFNLMDEPFAPIDD